jgi:UDP-GlcNAc:undecaprenyl-phosphate GlcNAc-1-phosphate transferase
MTNSILISASVTFLVGLVVTYLLVPLNIRFSRRAGLIDNPHPRGIHTTATPLAGGLALSIPVLIVALGTLLRYSNYTQEMIGLLIGGAATVLLGVLDDKKAFTARYKLIWQIIIIAVVYMLGIRIHLLTNPFGESLHLGFWSFPVTLGWFLLVMNAVNLIDGLDGLASGINAIVMLILLVVGLVYGNIAVAMLAAVMLGSSLAFLRYNFYPASIFLGDTGSLFIGFFVAALAVLGNESFKGVTAITMLIPIMTLVLPLSDTLLAVFRRMRRGSHIFQADKKHIHHRMLEFGFSQPTIVIICYFITFLFGLIGLGFIFISKQILVILLLVLFTLLSLFFAKIFTKGR